MKQNEIKALSWKQPFASLMLHGKIETRSRPTKYRGYVLICVSLLPKTNEEIIKMCTPDNIENIYSIFSTSLYKINALCGKAMAVAKLVDCRPMKKEDEAKCFVAYDPKLYCHVYEDVREIKPFPWKGARGWKNLTDVDIEKIEFLNP